jgi:hypothetical protein
MNTAGQGFATLTDEISGCRSQHKKPSGAAVPIHQSAEQRKEAGLSLDLVDTDQLRRVFLKEELGVGELSQIGGEFEVQE